ncbi:ABC transporter permease [bacterium]|nr:ABC transporter permease [bacterium]
MNSPLARLNRFLMSILVTNENHHSLQSDLEDEYEDIRNQHSFIAAQLWMCKQVFTSLFEVASLSTLWSFRLFVNELKVAFRMFRKQKLFSVVNITGLSLGLACVMIITLFVYHEFSFDRFHENGDRIYRLEYERERRGVTMSLASAGAVHVDLLEEALPGLEAVVRMKQHYQISSTVENIQFSVDPLYVSEDFFKMFSFSLLKGDEKTALSIPSGTVITPELSIKYFGDADPIGRIIQMEDDQSVIVTGILNPLPQNSHIQSEMIVAYSGLKRDYKSLINTYLLFKDYVDVSDIESQINEILKPHFREESDHYELISLMQIHFSKKQALDLARKSKSDMSVMLLLLAISVLLVSCINFTNLSVARSLTRMKEVGLRKVIGARRGQIRRQFIVESMIYTLISMGIGYLLMWLILPIIEKYTHVSFNSHLQQSFLLYGIYFLVVLITGLLAGFYPALYASAFSPAAMIKGMHIGVKNQKAHFRNGLSIIQFSISALLLIVSCVIFLQMRYLFRQNLGFDGEQIITVSYFKDEGINANPQRFKDDIVKLAGVEAASIGLSSPGYDSRSIFGVNPVGADPDNLRIPVVDIDHDYFSVFRVPLKEGRWFRDGLTSDFGNTVIINESAMRAFSMSDPIGQKIYFSFHDTTAVIVGVVEDFHMESLRRPIRPVVFYNKGWLWGSLMIRLHPESGRETIRAIQKVWDNYATQEPFEYLHYNDRVKQLYNSEAMLLKIVAVVSVFSILIACLGLFGLSAFIIKSRTKEVGIRKVLGASFYDIGLLLSRKFFMLIILSNMIVWLPAYYITTRWFRQFAYHTSFPLWGPPLVMIMMAVFALIIVNIHALRTARMNPVKTLRCE